MTEQEAAAAEQQGRATAMLVVVTLLWGLPFSWMKNWQQASAACPGGPLLAALTLIALRMALGVVLLTAWQPHLLRGATRREHAAGAAIGVAFFIGFTLQVWGLAWTTPARSAFFTCLCCAWAPLLLWAGAGVPVAGLTLLGLGLGLAGTAVLGLDYRGGWVLGRGETLTLLASLLFALQLLLLDRLGRAVRPSYLTVGFFAVTAVLAWGSVGALAAEGPGLRAWRGWTLGMLGNPYVLRDLLCLTLLPTVLAFHWMTCYQPLLPANRAALIYLLEPVFASSCSVLLGYERVTHRLVLGGLAIIIGNCLPLISCRGRPSKRAPVDPALDGR